MRFHPFLALSALVKLGSSALIVGEQQHVLQQASTSTTISVPPQIETLDDIFRAASVGKKQEIDVDLESSYVNAWISCVENLPRYGKVTGIKPLASWWKVVKNSLTSSVDLTDIRGKDNQLDGPSPPSRPPPHHDPNHDHPQPPHRRPHRGRGRHHPHNFTSGTVYENLGRSNYTTKIFKLISDDIGLTKILNSTKHNITFFAPTDEAFEKIPKHGKHPDPEFIKNLLYYHVSGDLYPASKILLGHTIPSMLKEEKLGGPDQLQRLRIGIGLGGLHINFYSKVVAANVFSKNGVIHGIDHILVPPPPALTVLELLPGEFSILVNALYKTGLVDSLNTTDSIGLTLFAPTNNEFKRLGSRVLGFLFSKYGEKYLTALIKYHIVPDQTLYSDAWYNPKADEGVLIGHEHGHIPKGRFHADLKTALDDKSLSIDIIRWGRLIDYKINAFARVAIQDGIVKDGVIQVPDRVLIPPKTTPPISMEDDGGVLTVEEFKARFDPYLRS